MADYEQLRAEYIVALRELDVLLPDILRYFDQPHVCAPLMDAAAQHFAVMQSAVRQRTGKP